MLVVSVGQQTLFLEGKQNTKRQKFILLLAVCKLFSFNFFAVWRKKTKLLPRQNDLYFTIFTCLEDIHLPNPVSFKTMSNITNYLNQ